MESDDNALSAAGAKNVFLSTLSAWRATTAAFIDVI